MLRFHVPPVPRCSRAPRPSSRTPGTDPRVVALVIRRYGAAAGTFRTLATVVALTVALAAKADPWEWTLQGLVDLRVRGSEHDATRLVPEPKRIGVDPGFLSATAVTGLQAWSGPVTVSGTGRLFARTAPRRNRRAMRLHLDELHAEYAITPEHFLYAGRRHIVHGRSLGVNPLDVALDPGELDRSKDTNRRRSEIEGQDMVGFESLLGDRFTLTGYWTPGERALMAGAVTLPEWKSDLTALVFDDQRPGAGVSFSRTLGEALLAYADVAVHRGRDRMVVRADRRTSAGPGTFLAEDGNRSGLFAKSTVGAGFTLNSGATFNLEYHFDANGYSTREWDEITGLIVENDEARMDERFGALATGNLLRLGAQLDRFTLRRHYGFLRVQHPDLSGANLTAEMAVFHNLVDHSGSLGLRLEHEMGPNLLLGVETRNLYGGDLDEYGLRTGRLSGSVHVTVYF